MNGIFELAKLDSKEVIFRRDQAMRDKQNHKSILESVAPYRIKQDSKVQIEVCELRINELNEELKRRQQVQQKARC